MFVARLKFLQQNVSFYQKLSMTDIAAMQKFEYSSNFDLHGLPEEPPQVDLTKDETRLYIKQMCLIRRMETAATVLYQENLIRGFCHPYAGQEACAVGLRSAMRPNDTVITSYRCHAWPVLMAKDNLEGVKGVLAELLGKVTGLGKGRAGSVHLYADRFYGGHGIVGAQIPLGTGLAFKHKYKNDGGLTFAIMGDGCMNQGQVYEAFNMAKLYNLPVIYVVENNKYSMGTSCARGSANTDYYKRGDLIPGIRTNGMDITDVRRATMFAVNHVSSGKGPILLEFKTYRYWGHSMSDPGDSYRTRDEVKQVRDTMDPIKLLGDRMIDLGYATAEEIKLVVHEAKKVVEKIVEHVKTDEAPPVEDLTRNVYSEYRGKIRHTSDYFSGLRIEAKDVK